MMNIFAVKDAIASVALSHPEDHDCDVCKASKGDQEAFERVVRSLLSREK